MFDSSSFIKLMFLFLSSMTIHFSIFELPQFSDVQFFHSPKQAILSSSLFLIFLLSSPSSFLLALSAIDLETKSAFLKLPTLLLSHLFDFHI